MDKIRKFSIFIFIVDLQEQDISTDIMKKSCIHIHSREDSRIIRDIKIFTVSLAQTKAGQQKLGTDLGVGNPVVP